MKIDSFGIESPPAGLYDFSGQITKGIDGFNQVSDAHLEQFHYRPASVAPFDNDDRRLAAFGSEGKDAAC